MNRRIWKALGIAVCMLALAAPRAMAETNSHYVSNNEQFADAVRTINNESKIGDKNEIVLMQDITLERNYILTNGKTTTIKGKEGEDRKISINGSNDPNAGITVTGERTVLNLGVNGYDKKLTIDGDTRDGSASGNAKNAFVSVLEGATANMYGNVTLQNGMFGGNACVVIMGSKSVFNMDGGVIENCSRAVTAASGATFHMQGGKILNCVSENNGGGVRLYEATFIMEGGTISGCTADEGGGLYAINSSTNSSTVNISGGTISGCTAVIGNGGGLYVDGSTITISGGTISGCKALLSNNKGNGGGLYAKNKSTITINKGTISGCEGRWGGGLYAEDSSTITITDSTISGCKAGAGGGLCVVGSTLNIKDDIISKCFVSDTGKGGGLYAENNSILTISGGTIKGNKAAYGGGVALKDSRVKEEEPITSWTVVDNEAYKTDTGRGYIGGGIYLESGSMDVSNGSNKIYNNTADGHGADICLTDDTSSIKLPNAANMGAKYHDSGINIDNWYNDNPRYTPSENGQVVEANKLLNGGLSLVASYKASPVRIEIDANGGVGGSGSQTVQKGTNVTLEAPTKKGYLFKGWKDEKGNSYPAGEDGKVKITVTGDMTLTAEWKKLPSAENLPKTGDESPVLLWGAALAVSAAACFMLRRRK